MRYQTLDLHVTRRDDDGFVVHAEWAHGRGSDVFEIDPGLESDLARLATHEVDRAFLRDVGRRLFDRLLRSGEGHAGEQLNQCWGATKRQPGRGMRIRLRFGAPSVGALPWEFLFWPSRDCFVGTSVRTGLVRFLDVPDTLADPEVRLPVRVLIVSPRAPDLDSRTEVDNLTSVLDGLAGVEYGVLDGVVTRDRIRDALRELEYQVLHFIGHGGVDESGPYIVLNLEAGNDRPATGDEGLDDEQFAGLLENHPSLELITLNSCRGATQGPGGPFVGMAQRLVARGVPAVVAMQFRIYDRVALHFAREFYRSLFTGRNRGDVEVAVARARKALETDFPDTPALGTPVLLLNREHGVLFDLVSGRFLRDVPTSVERAHVLRGVEEIRRKRVAWLSGKVAEAEEGADRPAGPVPEEAALRADATTTVEEARAALEAERAALRKVRRRFRTGATLAALPVAVAVVVFAVSWLSVLDRFSRWARLETLTVRLAELGGPEDVHPDVAVVAIDSLDVEEEGEPWGTAWRPRIATLVDRVSEAGASVIALDVHFGEGTAHDDTLAAAIRRAGARGTDVVLGVAELEGGEPRIAPALRFTDWGTLCAATGAQQVLDLGVRKPGNGGRPRDLPSLPLRAVAAHRDLRISGLDPAGRRVLLLDPDDRVVDVRFAALERISKEHPGCPLIQTGDTVASLVVDYSRRGALRDARRRLSYGAVVGSDGASGRLRDKLVIVGSETGDVVVSLYPGLGGERRFGFEFMADAASTLLSGEVIRPLTGWASFLLILTLTFTGAGLAVWPGRARRRTMAAILGGVLLLLVAGAVWAYRAAGLMILVAYPALALFLGFWGMATARRWRFT